MDFGAAKINGQFLFTGVVLWIQEICVVNFTKGEILSLEMKTVTQYPAQLRDELATRVIIVN